MQITRKKNKEKVEGIHGRGLQNFKLERLIRNISRDNQRKFKQASTLIEKEENKNLVDKINLYTSNQIKAWVRKLYLSFFFVLYKQIRI